jgi:E3 ubiquitin-protein ligase BRE1
MDETIRQANIEMQGENRNLQALNTTLHEKYHTISLKVHVLESLWSEFKLEFHRN